MTVQRSLIVWAIESAKNDRPHVARFADKWIEKYDALERDQEFYQRVKRQRECADPVTQHARWRALSKALRQLLDDHGKQLEDLGYLRERIWESEAR